jgi:hypothetical protein
MKFIIRFLLEGNIDTTSLKIAHRLEDYINSKNYGDSLEYMGLFIYIRNKEYFSYKTNKLDGTKASISFRDNKTAVYVRKRILFENFKNATLPEQQLLIAEVIKGGIIDLKNYKRFPEKIEIRELEIDVKDFLKENL